MSFSSDDVISRCMIFPQCFDEQGSYSDGILFQFGETKADGAAHQSAVLRRLCPADEGVHEVGCFIARKQNAERQHPAFDDKKRRYYCGFKSAIYSEIPTGGDGYRVELTLKPEGNMVSHVDVALFIDVTGKSARALARTDAGLDLALVFGPPTAHICLEDRGIEHHPLVKDPFCLTGRPSLSST